MKTAADIIDEALGGLDLSPAPVDTPPCPAGVRERPWRRFWSKVDRGEGCWTWTGATRVGYGAFKTNGQTVAAHRLAFEWVVGPIPAGKVLDHLCGNRACVNPSHLDVTTHRENVRRGSDPHFEVSA